MCVYIYIYIYGGVLLALLLLGRHRGRASPSVARPPVSARPVAIYS